MAFCHEERYDVSHAIAIYIATPAMAFVTQGPCFHASCYFACRYQYAATAAADTGLSRTIIWHHLSTTRIPLLPLLSYYCIIIEGYFITLQSQVVVGCHITDIHTQYYIRHILYYFFIDTEIHYIIILLLLL